MHSGGLILAWVAGVGFLQCLAVDDLLAVVAALASLALLLAYRRTLRLMRRVRILLIAIVVLFAGFTPGEALLVDWPAFSPSREGVLQALEHAGRLLAVVCCVAILLERLPADRLVGGLYALSRPFVLFGLSAERLAVRMLLVLRYVDAPGGRGWRDWLTEDDESARECLHLQRERFGPADLALATLLAVAIVWSVAR